MALDQDSLWDRVSHCFDTDDGSLPGIVLDRLSLRGVAEIYRMLRERSHVVGESAEYWCNVEETSKSVDSVRNAAELVTTQQAAPFHVCVGGIVVGDVELPTLGVFVFPDGIELDYRMGKEWDSQTVFAFFELLRHCCELDDCAVVTPAETEGPPDSKSFRDAWQAFQQTH